MRQGFTPDTSHPGLSKGTVGKREEVRLQEECWEGEEKKEEGKEEEE